MRSLPVRVKRLAYRDKNVFLLSGLLVLLLSHLFIPVFAADTINAESGIPSMELAGEKNPFGAAVTRYPENPADLNFDIYEKLKGGVKSTEAIIKPLDNLDYFSASKGRELIFIIVEASLMPSLKLELYRYLDDLAFDGYRTEIYTYAGGDENDLRAFLAENYYSRQLSGALLIGDLPIAYYEMTGCFNYVAYEGFPCDLFYMDLDGEWNDANNNGLYDSHKGQLLPEIFIGRLTASGLIYLGSDETTLLKNYFQKDHSYRSGQLSVEKRALLYLDDDWQNMSIEWRADMSLAYQDIVIQQDPKSTTAEGYRYNLQRAYELVHLAVHSFPTEHWFKAPPDQWQGIFDFRDLVESDANAMFYVLFACSNARYISKNYMAGWYIFGPSNGLVSLGSTKIGGMLNFASFYEPLGQNVSFGQAYLNWFREQVADYFDYWEKCWYYGLTLCGDPLLKMDMIHQPLALEVDVPESYVCRYLQDIRLRLSATGGLPPYTWAILNGSLPEGVVLDSSVAALAGIVGKTGCYDLTFEIRDSDTPARCDTVALQIEVLCGRGDANADGIINIGDIVFLNQYIFHNGEAPATLEDGDINCDGSANFADLITLVNHIFRTRSLNPCKKN